MPSIWSQIKKVTGVLGNASKPKEKAPPAPPPPRKKPPQTAAEAAAQIHVEALAKEAPASREFRLRKQREKLRQMQGP